MSTSKKTPAADRHHGGPGSSHQREDRPDPTEHGGAKHGEATGEAKPSGGDGRRGKGGGKGEGKGGGEGDGPDRAR